MTFPGGITTIEVTGLNLLAFDGTPLNGSVTFTVDGEVAVPAADTVLVGSATGIVTNGVMSPVTLPTTDNISPGFSYSITQNLQTSDGVTSSPAPVQGVGIPSTLGVTVDLSDLVPAGPPPDANAYNTAHTWTQTQTFAGSPPLVLQGALAPAVVRLSYAASIPVNAALGNDFRLTLTGNATIATPTNPVDGQAIIFQLTQDVTGGRTVTWGSGYHFGSSGPPTLSGAGDTDLVGFKYNASRLAWLYAGSTLGF